DERESTRSPDRDCGARLRESSLLEAERVVRHVHTGLERVQLLILKDLPPGAAKRLIGRPRGLPSIFQVRPGDLVRCRPLIRRRARTRGRQHDEGSCTACLHRGDPLPSEACATRTVAPSARESGGSRTMTSSPFRPDNTSTLLPKSRPSVTGR